MLPASHGQVVPSGPGGQRAQEVSCVALQCQAPCLPAASSLQEPLLASRVLGVKKDLFENVCKWRWG